MPSHLEAANPFGRFLEPGERLLWSGAPNAGGLLLANLGGIWGSLFWAALCGIAFVYAILARQETGFAASGVMLVIALYALYRNLRTALGSRHIRYAITSARILSIDDRDAAPFIVYRRLPEDQMREAWLDGQAKRGWRHGGRATVKIRYKKYLLGTGRLPDGFQHYWLRFTAVENPDAAVTLLNSGRAG